MKKIFMIALFGLTILLSTASAITELKETIREITSSSWSDTRKIEINEYLVYKFHGASTNKVDVTIEVVSGDSIDMILLSSENFTGYQSMMKSGKPKPYDSYSTGKGMNLRYITYSFEIPADGIYYIVEDNTYLPNNGGAPGGSVEAKIKFNKTRCLECEEAALETRRIIEEEARQYEEAQRKLREEMNRSKEPKSTPGFEAIFSTLVMAAVYLFGRKK